MSFSIRKVVTPTIIMITMKKRRRKTRIYSPSITAWEMVEMEEVKIKQMICF